MFCSESVAGEKVRANVKCEWLSERVCVNVVYVCVSVSKNKARQEAAEALEVTFCLFLIIFSY